MSLSTCEPLAPLLCCKVRPTPGAPAARVDGRLMRSFLCTASDWKVSDGVLAKRGVFFLAGVVFFEVAIPSCGDLRGRTS